MADTPAFQPLSGWRRWVIRTQPRWDMFCALAFLALPILITTFLLVGLLIFLAVLLVDALT